LYPNEKAVYVFRGNLFYKRSNTELYNISFQQSDFPQIAAHIKEVFGKTVINNSDKKKWRFTGQFKNSSAMDIIESICLIKNLGSKEQADTIFINNK